MVFRYPLPCIDEELQRRKALLAIDDMTNGHVTRLSLQLIQDDRAKEVRCNRCRAPEPDALSNRFSATVRTSLHSGAH